MKSRAFASFNRLSNSAARARSDFDRCSNEKRRAAFAICFSEFDSSTGPLTDFSWRQRWRELAADLNAEQRSSYAATFRVSDRRHLILAAVARSTRRAHPSTYTFSAS